MNGLNRESIEQVIERIKDADRVDASMNEPVSTTAATATQDALPLLEKMLAALDKADAALTARGVRADADETDPVRAALLLHLRQCGFVDPDDGTVARFAGDLYSPVVWTPAEQLADAVLARFELKDRQAEPGES